MNHWKSLIKPKSGERHKYDYGHVVIPAGPEMTGAACLASISALRMGAGIVTIVAHPQTENIFRSFSPSLIVETLENFSDFISHIDDTRRNAVLIGPGAGREDRRGLKKAVLNALDTKKLCVIDADAISVFEDAPEKLLEKLHDKCVLTPHEGEFKRLFPGISGSREERTLESAQKSGAIIVLKGHATLIAHPEGRLVTNDNGTGWLATAGSGDVLAGMITGFGAYHENELFDAVCACVWMHAEAAQIAGPGMISADLPSRLPEVWVKLLSRETT